jgi:hypothetical protein
VTATLPPRGDATQNVDFDGNTWRFTTRKASPSATFFIMKRLTTAVFSGLFAVATLSACSADGAGTDFCDVSQKLAADDIEFAELADADVQSAMDGDMSGVHEWGDSVASTIDDLSSDIERAKGGAPSDEAVQALDDVLDGIAFMSDIATAAAEAEDFATFAEKMTAMQGDLAEFDATMSNASDVLDKAEVEYCN